MKIKTLKGIKEVNEIFPNIESFKNYVLKLDNNLRYDNEKIKKEIEELFVKLKNQDGLISYSLMRGWLIKNYGFKSKKWGELNYWIERGWTEEDALIVVHKRNEETKKRNRLCVEYWINKGYTNEEATNEISKQQQRSSKCIKNKHGKSKKRLREKGYSEEEIRRICLTPSNVEFWIKKGYSLEESEKLIKKNQSNAVKYVDYEKRVLPSNIEYWLKRGFSKKEAKEMVHNHQSTFSLEKCIKKYGEEEGKKRFTERQNKWLDSLLSNGNMTIGYSKISQILFYILLDKYEISKRNEIYFATHNKEYTLEKEDGRGVWLYDFTDIKNKKIIEYHGDEYHANPTKYRPTDYPHPFRKNITALEIWNKDKRKIDNAINNGFDVLVIWDSEFRWGKKEETIKKCLDFLKN